VAVLHRGIVRLLFGVDYASFGPDEVFLQAAPLSFDAATFEIWGALLHGGCCAIYPEDVPSAEELGSAIREYGVTTLWLTAALFNFVIDERPDVLIPVRQLLTGGEALSVPHVRRALDRLPGTVLVNGYGPTEGTTFTCCYRIPRELPAAIASIPIGQPIGGTEVYILDQNREPVTGGSSGELYIGGDGVARGYINRADLTGERFLENRFTGRGKLYRTGDLVRRMPDGNLEFLGRLDSQVKIRGYRIEPGEIEAVLVSHASVRAAVVIPASAPDGELCLHAYVSARPDCALSESDLRDHLRMKLPAYMIPSRILLDQIPLTSTGKLDRATLQSRERQVVPDEPAMDEDERILASIWQELLGIDNVGPDSNFFDLGGHSIMVLQLANRIGKAFGRKPPIAELFRAATLRSMAGILHDRSAAECSGTLVPIQSCGSKPRLFGVHDVRGQVLLFASLSAYLGPDQPIYGLQPRALSAAEAPTLRIEDLAAEYVKAIRAIQPAGPYRLAGACFGGVVAFEMASQLEAAGERVDLLALIDAFAPNRLESMPWSRKWRGRVRSLGARLALHAASLSRLGPADTIRYLERSFRTIRRRMGDRFWALRSRWYAGNGSEDCQMAERAAYCALKRYVPHPYGGSAVLFRAANRSQLHADLHAGWADLIRGGIEICEIPGDHLTMLSHPNRVVLANELARRLTCSLAIPAQHCG
jgi:aspartate racemase